MLEVFWWREAHGQLEIDLQLPFELGRTDILSASTRCDIKNVNLIATLILHEELEGFWSDLGRQLRQDIDKLLQDHQLSGLLNASWIADGTKANANDWEYFQALRELTFYTLSENERIRRTAQIGNSILFGIHDLLDTYRTEMKVQSAEAFGRK